MTTEEFYVANFLEDDGWEYNGTTDAGNMQFTRNIGGSVWVIEPKLDR